MVFSSVEFLFFFLPATLLAYHAAPARWRNPVLLLASLVFYTWGGGAFVFVLLASISVNYVAGRSIASAVVAGDERRRNIGVAVSVASNLAILSWFKYANFAVEQLNAVGDTIGFGDIAWTSVALPIGISFYTFQSMSYTIDVARGRTDALRNPLDFALYVALFPQLIAGPIVRFHQIAAEIRKRRRRLDDFAEGAVRFSYGLGKKVIIADSLAPLADAAFDSSAGDLSAVGAWIGLLAFAFQIYFDFSGYSDMAIGLGLMLGFHFPENFRRPYSALSITDFWRRWHITLSAWFRDYLYVPLGGNRGTAGRTAFNLILVFAATGIWHGAAWTFLAWGMVHGGFLLWERQRGTRYVDHAPNEVLARLRTFAVVLAAWVLFRSNSLTDAGSYFVALLGGGTGLVSGDLVLRSMDTREIAIGLVALASLALPRTFFGGTMTAQGRGRAAGLARATTVFVVLPVSLLLVVSGTFSPFLYFQF